MKKINLENVLTNQEIIQIARDNLDQGPWDYLVGGAESETTMPYLGTADMWHDKIRSFISYQTKIFK